MAGVRIAVVSGHAWQGVDGGRLSHPLGSDGVRAGDQTTSIWTVVRVG